MVLTFGKHKGKSIDELMNEEEYSYIVWLSDNVSGVSVNKEIYNYCKAEVVRDIIMYEAKMENEHSD